MIESSKRFKKACNRFRNAGEGKLNNVFGGVPGSEGREAGKSAKEERAKTLIHHLFGRFRTIQKGLVCASAYASNPRSVSHKFF